MKTTVFLLVAIAFLSAKPLAQNHSATETFLDRTTFKLSTDFVNTPAEPNSFTVPSDLFTSVPSIGLEVDYLLSDHFVIGFGLTYTGNRSESIGILDYFVRPEDDATHTIRTSDRFNSISFDPSVELQFSLSKFDFFWSAGPILSFATLKSTTENSTFSNPNSFKVQYSSSSHSIGYGARASTGLQYFFSQKIGLSIEVGYKSVIHNSLFAQEDFGTEKEKVAYNLNSPFQRVGLILRL